LDGFLVKTLNPPPYPTMKRHCRQAVVIPPKPNPTPHLINKYQATRR
jgi:hypothetical protein